MLEVSIWLQCEDGYWYVLARVLLDETKFSEQVDYLGDDLRSKQ